MAQQARSESGTAISALSSLMVDGLASHEKKKRLISNACNVRDVASLVALCTSTGGLLDDESRQKAWPILLGCNDSSRTDSQDRDTLPRHRDEDQVQLDVNRSFIYYPQNPSEKELDGRKKELSDVITNVLRRNPFLCYFQGYHDIVQVFLLVLGKDKATLAVSYLSLFRIRDFMLPSLQPSLTHLQLLPAIVYAVDAKLCQHLLGTRPFFALAATLTLYSHEIEDYGKIARLFDFLLAHEPATSIYVFAVIVLSRKEELFDIPADEPEMLHFTLSKLPKDLDFEVILAQAVELFNDHPPHTLPFGAWRRVSAFSVLKTTRTSDIGVTQNVEEGKGLFEKQELELKRSERLENAMAVMRKHRKPAGSVALAVLIGLVSYWLQRHPSGFMLSGMLERLRGYVRLW